MDFASERLHLLCCRSRRRIALNNSSRNSGFYCFIAQEQRSGLQDLSTPARCTIERQTNETRRHCHGKPEQSKWAKMRCRLKCVPAPDCTAHTLGLQLSALHQISIKPSVSRSDTMGLLGAPQAAQAAQAAHTGRQQEFSRPFKARNHAQGRHKTFNASTQSLGCR